MTESQVTIDNTVFIAARGTVVALDRFDGTVRWRWKARVGGGFWGRFRFAGFTSICIDRDRLLVATANGIWCLDPMTGTEVWTSPLKDFRNGFPVIASGTSLSSVAAASAVVAAQQAAMMAATAGAGAAGAVG
ncbi:MAG: PQQ-binding-like beta-propeller repeat protein [Planctomycetota bacterium]|nr:PQQ-binding-like beta-propeller repeat protein [Planctomycetota bacterium]